MEKKYNSEQKSFVRALYLHIPFCARKCHFCSFAIAVNQTHRVREYLDALGREADARPVADILGSVYVGGGTPSCLSEEEAVLLWERTVGKFSVGGGAEVTWEFNPESVTLPKARLLRGLGVTRASLGIQSLNAERLLYLDRAHRREDAITAFEILRTAGFSNVSVDVMYGFPGQRSEELARDMREVLALHPDHLSVYQLTIEERSLLFARGQRGYLEEDPSLDDAVVETARTAGLLQYEISNFSRPGYESRHNINYWEGGEYLGLGMAAHSHVRGRRSWNAETLFSYLEAVRDRGTAEAGGEELPPAEKMVEAFLFGLRMNRGVSLEELRSRFGTELSGEKIEAIESFVEMGFLEEAGDRIRTTVRGRRVLDEISARLV
ncbi:MAG: radical SAM family heme chaperone HemW [Elusimicrobia bacterium]|nr:radical SAM family heme chaperone HemW [Elusimicrobiota bacterium]